MPLPVSSNAPAQVCGRLCDRHAFRHRGQENRNTRVDGQGGNREAEWGDPNGRISGRPLRATVQMAVPPGGTKASALRVAWSDVGSLRVSLSESAQRQSIAEGCDVDADSCAWLF